jgi:hypothetical protein
MNDNSIVWVASFDIGKKNFAFYIEEFDKSELIKLPYIPNIKRYNDDGTTTPSFSKIVNDVCMNGKSILFQNSDLTEGCKKGSYLDPETYHNMTDLLDEYVGYWDQCDAFVIEKQMSFGKRHNTMALKLGQHCWSYFSFKYGRFKEIIEFPAYHKTQILGAKKIQTIMKKGNVKYTSIDKPARKKWSVEKAMSILKERKDFDTISNLTSARKRDDLADVLCQLQAFKILVYIDKKI